MKKIIFISFLLSSVAHSQNLYTDVKTCRSIKLASVTSAGSEGEFIVVDRSGDEGRNARCAILDDDGLISVLYLQLSLIKKASGWDDANEEKASKLNSGAAREKLMNSFAKTLEDIETKSIDDWDVIKSALINRLEKLVSWINGVENRTPVLEREKTAAQTAITQLKRLDSPVTVGAITNLFRPMSDFVINHAYTVLCNMKDGTQVKFEKPLPAVLALSIYPDDAFHRPAIENGTIYSSIDGLDNSCTLGIHSNPAEFSRGILSPRVPPPTPAPPPNPNRGEK